MITERIESVRYSMMEWYMSPVECDLTLYYNSDLNRLITEDSEILNDIHDLLSPWQINYAKQIGMIDGYCMLTSKNGKVIEIFFPDEYYDMLNWEVFEQYYDMFNCEVFEQYCMDQEYLYTIAVNNERRYTQ